MRCFELAPGFLRGIIRLVSLSWLSAKELERKQRFSPTKKEGEEPDAEPPPEALVELCSECERTCRAGLAIEPANEQLRKALQELRDANFYTVEGSEGDAKLRDVEAAQRHKAEGNTAFAAKDYDKASNSFTAAMSYDPLDHVFYSNRSACRSALFKSEEALADADRCVELKPDWAKGYNRRAVALYNLGRYPEAEAACLAGLEVEKGSAPLQDMLATCRKETCETPAVQAHMARMRADARQQEQMDALLSKLNMGGGPGGPSVFNMPGAGGSAAGMADFMKNLGGGAGGAGGFGGFGGQKPKMNETQMRQMARAMASGEGKSSPGGAAPGPGWEAMEVPTSTVEDGDGSDDGIVVE